jgi:hypothetical protein
MRTRVWSNGQVTTTLEARTLAAYVDEIARAFGVEASAVAGLRTRLEDVRPIASAASVGEVLDALRAAARAGGTARRARKLLAELEDLVAAGTYARTKRAERGRVFALLLVVFDLVALVGVDIDAENPEKTLKSVRRARR